jgi:hypothetical protein
MLASVPDRGIGHASQRTRLRIQKLGPSMAGSRLARPRTLLPAGRAGGCFDVSALVPGSATAPAVATATAARGVLPWRATSGPSHFGWRV